MKKILFFLILLLSNSCAYAIYDFCESPQDYNTFPQAYDVRTEYWNDIPEYNAQSIKVKTDKELNTSDKSKFKILPFDNKNKNFEK